MSGAFVLLLQQRRKWPLLRANMIKFGRGIEAAMRLRTRMRVYANVADVRMKTAVPYERSFFQLGRVLMSF